MGIVGSAGSERPPAAGRSIPTSFILTVALPAAGLVVLWGLVLAAAYGGLFGGHRLSWPSQHDPVTLTLPAGGGLIVIIGCVLLAGAFTRGLRRDIGDLEAAARQLAEVQLPRAVAGVRRGERMAEALRAPPRLAVKTREIGRIGTAIASCQRAAVAAAAGESSLRNGLGQVFVSLARRNQSLLQRQLRLIDALEQRAADPAALADLFPLDHLTTRMRRHAESLIILSGAAPGRSWSQPVPVIDIIRGAVAEVEDYTRVRVVTAAGDAVAGSAAADMIHLLAELIENATLFSPSSTRAEVRAERVANGFVIEVDDRGLGIKPDQLAAINEQLARPPDFDLANADRLGLFVVGRLAVRHGVTVSLRPSPFGGTSAVVLLPNSIVVPAAATQVALPPGAHAAPDAGRLDLRGAPALALTARHSAPPALADAGPAGAGALGTGQGRPALGGGLDAAAFEVPSSDRPSLDGPGLDRPTIDASVLEATDLGGFGGPAVRGLAPGGPAPGGIGTGEPGAAGWAAGGGAGLGGASFGGAGPGGAGRGGAGLGRPGLRDSARGDAGVADPRLGLPGLGEPGPSGPGLGGPGLGGPGLGGPGLGGPGSSPSGPGGPGTGGLSTGGAGLGEPASGGQGFGLEPPAQPGQTEQSASAGTYRGLPRRVRQANLSPRLRDGGTAEAHSAGTMPLSAPPATPLAERTPQEARDLMSSLQSGWRRGREPDPPDETGPLARIGPLGSAGTPAGPRAPAGDEPGGWAGPPGVPYPAHPPDAPEIPDVPATREAPASATRQADGQQGPEAAGSEERL